ncbi:MAG: class C sortase [Ruminococcus sp.]|nr:class C sortase [Ruminococcus sp.]
MRKKSNVISTVVLIIILLVGLSVMLYPTFSDWWNTRQQNHAIENYQTAVSEMDDSETERILAEARAYNESLNQVYSPFSNYDEVEGYEDILDITGTGIMGYISIPVIDVELPIYHGTSSEVLNVAVGHLQGSSLPVGGADTHAVISAHRGLPSARLFTDLDKLVEGDTFTITVLDEVLTYEVEDIFIVLPTELDKLEVISGGDYVTLMTCTPYGINTHRLLIRAHRIETAYDTTVKVTADAVQLDTLSTVPYIAAPLLLILLFVWMFGGKRKRNRLTQKDIRSEIDCSGKDSDKNA